MKAARNHNRLSRDALYNLHEIVYDSDFVRYISTYPDLVVIMYNNETMEMFRHILTTSDVPQQLSYDTTFTLGDFYLSVVLFRQTEFESNPVIPLAFMLHERKTKTTHDVLWQHLRVACPELASTNNVNITTDGELAITSAIRDAFPSLPHFFCWNHVLQDAKRWLSSHGSKSADETRFNLDCMRDLFKCESHAAYTAKLIPLLSKWSQPFSAYFTDNIHKVITSIGSWCLRNHGFSEITTNQSESFNAVLKRLQDWKEVPVDVMALSLFRLTQFTVVEVLRGRVNTGEYHLREELQDAYRGTSATVPTATRPEDIVERIRQSTASKTTTAAAVPSTDDDVNEVSEAIDGTVSERATDVILRDAISLNAKLATFVVSGTTEPRVVRLFPKTTCSCPATSCCYHILAAKRAIGLDVVVKRKTVNLTQLRRNTRKRVDKTSGRKRPRPADVDVVQAGGSHFTQVRGSQ